MKKRMYLRKKYIFKNKIMLILILIILSVYLLFKFITAKITPILLNYAENETKRLSSIIVSNSIDEELINELKIGELFIITKENGSIKTIDFDPVILNSFLIKVIDKVQTNLKKIENGEIDTLDIDNKYLVNYDKEKLKKGIFFEIPMGVVFNNILLANLGPKIPVKFNLMGEILSNINTKITNYGINNALIETSINLQLTESVILPITSKKVTVEFNIPISLKVIQGNIPSYYFSGLDSRNIIVPVE